MESRLARKRKRPQSHLPNGRHGSLFCVLTASLLASPVYAATFDADFTSKDQWDETADTTALWDTLNHRVSAAIAANAKEIDFGDGSDGPFNDGPQQTGITVSGSTITFDTSVRSTYLFSSFNLSHGTTLVATGSRPLVIRVLGPTTIAGTIDLNGGNGTDNSLGGPAPGGAGGAGGGRGGDAGYGTTPNVAGLPGGNGQTFNGAGSLAFGGTPGANDVSGNDNGGGGGCNGSGGTFGALNGAGPAHGNAGTCASTTGTIAANFEVQFTGGSGGGGGGGMVTTTGSGPASGSGGGGGGGGLHFVSLGSILFGTNPSLGTIQSNGGRGGVTTYNPDGTGFDCGGGGGGGSGGSIWLQTTSAIGTTANRGTITVNKGAADISSACGNSAQGGDGSSGILRIDATSTNLVGSSTVDYPQTPNTRPNKTYTLTSKAFDVGNNKVSYRTPIETLDTTSSGCGTSGSLSVQYEGSNDGINFSGDVTKDEIATLNGHRYIRFKVTINTGTSPPAPCLTGLTIPYQSTHFDLKGGFACGSTLDRKKDRRGGSPIHEIAEIAPLLAAAAWTGLRARRRRRA